MAVQLCFYGPKVGRGIKSMSEGNPINILLVEDDEVDAMAVKRAFLKSKVNSNICVVKDGVEAYEKLTNSSLKAPLIIILDLNLPKMSGLELLEKIRSNSMLNSHIVFILTTSKADEDKLGAYSFNVAGYILKEKVSDNFNNLVKMLDIYWNMVEMPLTL